jgi:starch-binding outer membrane protein, SusD/RagB family
MRAKLRGASVALLLLLPGCGDMLTEAPESFLTPDNFFRTPQDAEAALVSVYTPLIGGPAFKNWLWQSLDVGSDIARVNPLEPSIEAHLPGRLASTAESRNVNGPWGSFYTTITRANVVIDRVSKISMNPTRKATIEAEARFLRAFSYFYLVRLYGDVPLLLTEAHHTADVTRAPWENVYEHLIADAQQAANVLPATWDDANAGRPTRGAALTLLAEVYLTRREWQQAADHAKQVIDLGVYSLYPDYLDAFLPVTENGPEHIFSLQANDVTTDLGSGFVFLYYPRELGLDRGGGFSVILPTEQHLASYVTGDYRKDVSYWTEGTNALGQRFTFQPHVYKFRPSQTTSISRGDVNWPIYRYAEVLLMYAEAVNELGQPAVAVTYLNQIRGRARNADGTPRIEPADYAGPLVQDAVREAIFVERNWEFAHECKRWFDLLRRGEQYFLEKLRADPEAIDLQPTDMLWPIPQREIDLSPGLTQNPGY